LFIISSDFCHWGRRFSYTFTDSAQVNGHSHAHKNYSTVVPRQALLLGI
jgi:predicted class III extradiol MEMO1 family dioxygenase